MEKGRLLGGVWKTFALYNGTGKPVSAGTPTDSDYAAQIARVKRWIAAYTDSPTPRISRACLYLNYSWLARGSGLANSVSESQWSLFKSRNAQAKAILLEAGTLKEKDPFWYEAMQLVAHDKAGTRPTSASYSIKPSLLNRSTATIIASMPDTFRTSGTSSVAISWPLLRKRPIGFRNRMAQCCTSRPLARSLAIASQTSRICIRSRTLSLNKATPTSLVSMAPQTLTPIASPSWPPPLRTSHQLTKLLPQTLLWTWKFGMSKALSTILVTGPNAH
jgi:hypothetical protein